MSDRTVEIMEAACRVVARSGVHKLRMAEVAREANVSNALVHYYFATRSELLIRAFEHADATATERCERELEGLSTALDGLEHILWTELDDEPDARAAWVLWAEMWNASVFDEALRPPVVERYDRWVDLIQRLIEKARDESSVAPSVDAAASAARLAALVDGLGQQILLGTLDTHRAGALMRGALGLELGVASVGRSRT